MRRIPRRSKRAINSTITNSIKSKKNGKEEDEENTE